MDKVKTMPGVLNKDITILSNIDLQEKRATFILTYNHLYNALVPQYVTDNNYISVEAIF